MQNTQKSSMQKIPPAVTFIVLRSMGKVCWTKDGTVRVLFYLTLFDNSYYISQQMTKTVEGVMMSLVVTCILSHAGVSQR